MFYSSGFLGGRENWVCREKSFAKVLEVETEILRAVGGWDAPSKTKGGFCLRLQKGSALPPQRAETLGLPQ